MSTNNIGPLIVGHRGASARAPENTLAAFSLAIEEGAEGLEFDVRLARDGVPVVFHDESLLRTGRTKALVSELTSAELARVDTGSWFEQAGSNTEFKDERVTTLADTLQFLAGFDGIIFVELKSGGHDLEPLTEAVAAVLRDSPLLPQIIVKSFRLAAIPRLRMLVPGVRTAALFAPKIMTILRKEKHMVAIAAEFGANELSIHYSLATVKLMESAGKHGFPVSIWTADNPRWVKRGMTLGLKSIITNDPAKLLARRAELNGISVSDAQ